MKKTLMTSVLVFIAVFALACGSNKMASNPEPQEKKGPEKLLETSHPQKPGWIYSIPDGAFVGVSTKQSEEQLARTDARRNAANEAVAYMGTMVKDKFERVRISFGLSSDVEDPTTSEKEFQKQLAANVLNQMKVKEQYVETWQTPTGIGYKVYCLATLPSGEMNDTYKKTAAGMAQAAAAKAKAEHQDVAKDQLEKASEMWKKMSEEGLFND